jgi:hypothetical protein
MKNLFIIAIALLLFGCTAPESQSPSRIEVDEYVILDFNPPKHVYVDLKRVRDNMIFEHVGLGKHCSGWSENFKIGDIITLKRYTYLDGGQEIIDFSRDEIRNCLCN